MFRAPEDDPERPSQLVGYPLRPRIDDAWVVEPSLRVALPEACAEPSCAEHAALSALLGRALGALGVRGGRYGEAYVCALWNCEGRCAFEVEEASRAHYARVQSPEIGRVWVHRADKVDYLDAKIKALDRQVSAEVRQQIDNFASIIDVPII